MIPGQEFPALANCHAPGLYSIPLHVGETNAQRMFIDSLGTVHTVAPHSHRYNLTLKVMRGTLAHTAWEPDPLGALSMYRFEWQSPIQGGTGRFQLKDEKPSRFNLSTDVMRAGEYVHLEGHEFHSLVTEPGTVWVVTEQRDTRESETLWYAPEYAPDLTGLYVPLPPPSVVTA